MNISPSMRQKTHKRRLNHRKFVKIVWHKGGLRGRLFLLMLYFGFFIGPLILIAVLALVKPFGIVNCVILAWLNGFFYLEGGFLEATFVNARIMKTLLKHGWDADDEHTHSLIEYLETHGNNGWAPGSLGWGIVCWTLFYIPLILSYFFGEWYYPVYGEWVWIVAELVILIPSLLLYFSFSFILTKRFNRRASEKGYDLRRLKETVLEKDKIAMKSENDRIARKSAKYRSRLIVARVIGYTGVVIIITSWIYAYMLGDTIYPFIVFATGMILIIIANMNAGKIYGYRSKPIKTKKMIKMISNNIGKKKDF